MTTIHRPISTARQRATLLVAALAAAAALLLGVGVASPAAAHDELTSASPQPDQTATAAVEQIELTFSEDLLDFDDATDGFAIQVTDANGLHFETECVARAANVVSAPVALGVPGDYLVTWQIVSSDGHTTSGEYSFDYAPPAGQVAAEGTDVSACETSTAPAGDKPGETAADNALDHDPTMFIVAAIVVGFVLLAAAVIVIVLIRQLGRRRDDETTDTTD